MLRVALPEGILGSSAGCIAERVLGIRRAIVSSLDTPSHRPWHEMLRILLATRQYRLSYGQRMKKDGGCKERISQIFDNFGGLGKGTTAIASLKA